MSRSKSTFVHVILMGEDKMPGSMTSSIPKGYQQVFMHERVKGLGLATGIGGGGEPHDINGRDRYTADGCRFH